MICLLYRQISGGSHRSPIARACLPAGREFFLLDFRRCCRLLWNFRCVVPFHSLFITRLPRKPIWLLSEFFLKCKRKSCVALLRLIEFLLSKILNDLPLLLTFSLLKTLRESILGLFPREERSLYWTSSTSLIWKRPIVVPSVVREQ